MIQKIEKNQPEHSNFRFFRQGKGSLCEMQYLLISSTNYPWRFKILSCVQKLREPLSFSFPSWVELFNRQSTMTDVESDAVATSRTRCFSTIKDKITKTLSAAGGRPAIPGIITNNKITLKNMVISLAVLGLEVLLYSEVFDCPVKHHEIYALSWLCAPPAIIFLVNLLIIGDIWKLSVPADVATLFPASSK